MCVQIDKLCINVSCLSGPLQITVLVSCMEPTTQRSLCSEKSGADPEFLKGVWSKYSPKDRAGNSEKWRCSDFFYSGPKEGEADPAPPMDPHLWDNGDRGLILVFPNDHSTNWNNSRPHMRCFEHCYISYHVFFPLYSVGSLLSAQLNHGLLCSGHVWTGHMGHHLVLAC